MRPTSRLDDGAARRGLELGQALGRLGVDAHLFGRGGSVGPLTDPEVRTVAAREFAHEFPCHLDAATEVRRDGNEIVVSWDGRTADGEADVGEARFDYVLAATGRRANVDGLGLERTGLALDSRGVPVHDVQSMRCGDSHVFIAGDATIDAPLLHEAADEGRLAGENAARFPEAWKRARRTSLGIVFSDPQIAMAGASHAQLVADGVDFATGAVSFTDQGRARVMLVNRGLLRVYGERGTGLLLGAEMVGPAAEHLAHLLAWTIQSRLTVTETLERPFYHPPVIEEGLRTALRILNHELGFGANPPARCIDCGPGG